MHLLLLRLPSAPNITTTPVLESTTSELFSTMETSELSTSSELESTTTEETTSNEVTDGRIIQPTDYYHFHDDDSLQILDFCFMISCNITCTNGRLNDITRIIDTLYRVSDYNLILKLEHKVYENGLNRLFKPRF